MFTPGCVFPNSFAPTCILSYLRTQRLQQSFLLLWAEKWTSPRADPPESSILRPCLICTWDRLKLCSVCNSKVRQVKPLDLEKLKLAICRWSRLIFSSRAITLEARPASSLHCWTRRLPNLSDGVKQFFSHTYTYKYKTRVLSCHKTGADSTKHKDRNTHILKRPITCPGQTPLHPPYPEFGQNGFQLSPTDSFWEPDDNINENDQVNNVNSVFFFMINIFIIQGFQSASVGGGGQLVRSVRLVV